MLPHRLTCHHSVLFYKDDSVVRDRVAAYIAAALRVGEPALVIAKPGLRHQLTIELHRQHVQGAPFGPARGSYIALDAEETLDRFCVDGKPDAAAFTRIIGGALGPLAAAGKPVAAYGEMVGILCERGHYGEAVRLEGMWNELLAKVNASLFCGYPGHLFQADEARPFYDQICAAHSHVAGAEAGAAA